MKRDKGELDALYLHALHQLAAEVKAGGRSGDGALVLGENALEVVQVFGSCRTAVYYIMRQRSLAEGVKVALELVMRTVVEEAQRASAARSVVNHLCHHRPAVVEKQLVAYAYLTGRLNKDVPKAHLLVQFAQEEHLYLCVGLLLRAVKTRREHLRIVEDESVALVEIVEHIAEIEILGVAVLILQRLSLVVRLVHVYLP